MKGVNRWEKQVGRVWWISQPRHGSMTALCHQCWQGKERHVGKPDNIQIWSCDQKITFTFWKQSLQDRNSFHWSMLELTCTLPSPLHKKGRGTKLTSLVPMVMSLDMTMRLTTLLVQWETLSHTTHCGYPPWLEATAKTKKKCTRFRPIWLAIILAMRFRCIVFTTVNSSSQDSQKNQCPRPSFSCRSHRCTYLQSRF